MPDASFLRNRQKQIALSQLQNRLQQEQLAFDPGEPEYDEYQAKLDTAQAKSTALTELRAKNRVGPSPPVRMPPS